MKSYVAKKEVCYYWPLVANLSQLCDLAIGMYV